MSNAQKIRQMLAQGKTVAEIAGRLKVSRQYIYAVKSSQKARERRKAKKAEPFKPVGIVEIASVSWKDKILNFWRGLWK